MKELGKECITFTKAQNSRAEQYKVGGATALPQSVGIRPSLTFEALSVPLLDF
jgi:hypothetical protein